MGRRKKEGRSRRGNERTKWRQKVGEVSVREAGKARMLAASTQAGTKALKQ